MEAPKLENRGEGSGEIAESVSPQQEMALSPIHGIPLYTLLGGLMLGVYLVGLDMTMLANVSLHTVSR
jgi:hypothetical protein